MLNKKRVDIVDIQLIRDIVELEDKVLGNPTNVYDFIKKNFLGVENEKFIVLYLNDDNQPIKIKTILLDVVNLFSFNTTEIMKLAILSNTTKLVVAAIHTDNEPSPSELDKHVYKKIKNEGNIIGIELLDYVVIADKRYYSFLEDKLLFEKTKS